MKVLYVGVAITVSAFIVGASFLFYPSAEKPEPVKPPVPVRYMPTKQLMRELSPFVARFPGEALSIPGAICHVSFSQPLQRVVIVCK